MMFLQVQNRNVTSKTKSIIQMTRKPNKLIIKNTIV